MLVLLYACQDKSESDRTLNICISLWIKVRFLCSIVWNGFSICSFRNCYFLNKVLFLFWMFIYLRSCFGIGYVGLRVTSVKKDRNIDKINNSPQLLIIRIEKLYQILAFTYKQCRYFVCVDNIFSVSHSILIRDILNYFISRSTLYFPHRNRIFYLPNQM